MAPVVLEIVVSSPLIHAVHCHHLNTNNHRDGNYQQRHPIISQNHSLFIKTIICWCCTNHPDGIPYPTKASPRRLKQQPPPPTPPPHPSVYSHTVNHKSTAVGVSTNISNPFIGSISRVRELSCMGKPPRSPHGSRPRSVT